MNICCIYIKICLNFPASDLVYTLVNGRTPTENQNGNFIHRGIVINSTHMLVEVFSLDYETTPWYSLRLRASVRYLSTYF